jgi:hypothetical protein
MLRRQYYDLFLNQAEIGFFVRRNLTVYDAKKFKTYFRLLVFADRGR